LEILEGERERGNRQEHTHPEGERERGTRQRQEKNEGEF